MFSRVLVRRRKPRRKAMIKMLLCLFTGPVIFQTAQRPSVECIPEVWSWAELEILTPIADPSFSFTGGLKNPKFDVNYRPLELPAFPNRATNLKS